MVMYAGDDDGIQKTTQALRLLRLRLRLYLRSACALCVLRRRRPASNVVLKMGIVIDHKHY